MGEGRETMTDSDATYVKRRLLNWLMVVLVPGLLFAIPSGVLA
jgi:hypothetical protein